MNFKSWLLLSENTNIAQLLKQSNDPIIKQIKSNVTKLVNAFAHNIKENIKSTFINFYTWNFYKSKESNFQTHIYSTKDYLMANYQKLNLTDPNFTLEQLTQESDEWHEELEANQAIPAREAETFIDLSHLGSQWKGWRWVSLDRYKCEMEAKSGGHCGNAAGIEGDNILSLRDPQNIANLTFIENKGILGETKGIKNSKPSPKFHQPIIELLKNDKIITIKGGGYLPKNNFSLDDLSNKEELLKLKPDLDFVNYHSKPEKIKYLTDEDIEYLFDKAKDKEKIENLVIQNKQDLSDDNVHQLLKNTKNTYEMSKTIIKKNPRLSDAIVLYLLEFAHDKDDMAKIILNNKPTISTKDVSTLLDKATNKDEIAKLIIEKNTEYGSNKVVNDNKIYFLLYHAIDKESIEKLLGAYSLNKLFDSTVAEFLKSSKDKDKTAEIIINYKTKLSSNNVYNLLHFAKNKASIAKLLGAYNISNIYEFDISNLLRFAIDRDKLAEIIIDYKTNFDNESVYNLLYYAVNKENIAKLLGTDNISKLELTSINHLLDFLPDKQKMAQVLNHYHTKKKPEIQELIDKYLHEL